MRIFVRFFHHIYFVFGTLGMEIMTKFHRNFRLQSNTNHFVEFCSNWKMFEAYCILHTFFYIILAKISMWFILLDGMCVIPHSFLHKSVYVKCLCRKFCQISAWKPFKFVLVHVDLRVWAHYRIDIFSRFIFFSVSPERIYCWKYDAQ